MTWGIRTCEDKPCQNNGACISATDGHGFLTYKYLLTLE